jgi:hypothetical protein
VFFYFSHSVNVPTELIKMNKNNINGNTKWKIFISVRTQVITTMTNYNSNYKLEDATYRQNPTKISTGNLPYFYMKYVFETIFIIYSLTSNHAVLVTYTYINIIYIYVYITSWTWIHLIKHKFCICLIKTFSIITQMSTLILLFLFPAWRNKYGNLSVSIMLLFFLSFYDNVTIFSFLLWF